MTDFVGWVPMADGGDHEAFLTSDYNAEMVEHVARYPRLRDRSVFVGDPEDLVAGSLGPDLPDDPRLDAGALRVQRLRDGRPPRRRGPTSDSGGGSGTPTTRSSASPASAGPRVGAPLLRRIIDAYDAASARVPAAADARGHRAPARPRSLSGATGRRGARLPARPRPAPRGVRRGHRAGRALDDHGAHRQPAAVPVLPAPPPLRAAGARAAPARAARRGSCHGLRDGRPGHDRARRWSRSSSGSSTTYPCRRTVRRRRLSWSPSSSDAGGRGPRPRCRRR